jgi:hypothetical protein
VRVGGAHPPLFTIVVSITYKVAAEWADTLTLGGSFMRALFCSQLIPLNGVAVQARQTTKAGTVSIRNRDGMATPLSWLS